MPSIAESLQVDPKTLSGKLTAYISRHFKQAGKTKIGVPISGGWIPVLRQRYALKLPGSKMWSGYK